MVEEGVRRACGCLASPMQLLEHGHEAIISVSALGGPMIQLLEHGHEAIISVSALGGPIIQLLEHGPALTDDTLRNEHMGSEWAGCWRHDVPV